MKRIYTCISYIYNIYNYISYIYILYILFVVGFYCSNMFYVFVFLRFYVFFWRFVLVFLFDDPFTMWQWLFLGTQWWYSGMLNAWGIIPLIFGITHLWPHSMIPHMCQFPINYVVFGECLNIRRKGWYMCVCVWVCDGCMLRCFFSC